MVRDVKYSDDEERPVPDFPLQKSYTSQGDHARSTMTRRSPRRRASACAAADAADPRSLTLAEQAQQALSSIRWRLAQTMFGAITIVLAAIAL